MKHVFCVHSHITFYMALATIKHQCLDISDVVFLTTRKYRNPYFRYTMNDFSEYAGKLSPFTLKSVFSLRKITKRMDFRLAEICQNDSYIAYVPHLSHPVFQLLITSKHCRGFHFIEEGMANYVPKNYESHFLNFSAGLQRMLDVFNFFHWRICLGHKVFGRFRNYAFEPSYFYLDSPYCRRGKTVVPLKLPQHEVKTRIPDNAAVVVLSPLLKYHLATDDGYRQCCSFLVEKVAEYTKTVYVKSHPETLPWELSMFRDIVKTSGCGMVEIDRDEPIEQLLLSLDGNVVAGIDSSVLFYAKVLNNRLKVISVYRYLMSHDDLFRERCGIKDIQDIFSKDIEVL